jgi:hypothetical protein
LTWPAVPEFPSRQRKSRLRERIETGVVVERAPAVVPPSPPPQPVFVARPEPTPVRTVEVAAPPVRVSPRQWLRTWVRTAWNDRLSRVCLIGSGASLWFSVGLADPHFLLPLLVFLPALWWRHRNRVEPTTEAEPEDWL